MEKINLAFVNKKLSLADKQKICDDVIYFIECILSEDPQKFNLVNISHRFRMDTLRSEVAALKKQLDRRDD